MVCLGTLLYAKCRMVGLLAGAHILCCLLTADVDHKELKVAQAWWKDSLVHYLAQLQ
jgi:hypothetical protein